MQATPLSKPWFVGACAFAAIAGMVSGATVNTQPLQRAGIGMHEIARPDIAFDPSGDGLSEQVAPPDHYALSTPEGRFEVAELSSRGLYAQRRFGWREASYIPLPEPAFADPEPLPLPTESVAAPEPEVAAVAEPAPPEGEPRTIDVETELASR